MTHCQAGQPPSTLFPLMPHGLVEPQAAFTSPKWAELLAATCSQPQRNSTTRVIQMQSLK